jgi:hypothetical protein
LVRRTKGNLELENFSIGAKIFTVKPLIEPHGALIFNPKILKIFTLVPPDLFLKKGGALLLKGALLEVLR